MASQENEGVQEAWDEIATGFDEYATPLTLPLAEEALRRVDLREGTRFLDVGAGSGGLSVPAARHGAEVTATDIAPTMIECLASRAHEEGLSNVETHVMDGCALDLEDDLFDVAASQNGVSLFPDIERGLAELVRVTRPGGRVLVVAFGDPRKAEFLGKTIGALQRAIPGFEGPSMDPPPLPFQVADPGKLRALLSDAGLNDVSVDTVTWEMEIHSAEQLWNTISNSNPVGAEIASKLTADQIDSVTEILDTDLRERAGGRWPAVLTAEMNVGIGTK